MNLRLLLRDLSIQGWHGHAVCVTMKPSEAHGHATAKRDHATRVTHHFMFYRALLMAGLGLAALAAVATAAPAQAAASGAKKVNQGKVTPEIERSVIRGLDFLERTQNKSDGSWGSQSNGQVSGVVGLAMMTMLAHGEVPDDSKYGRVIKLATDYMIKTQDQTNGLLSGRSGSSPMYSHGFATLALAEVYGQSQDPRVGSALKKAVGLILRSQEQNPQGAWRYSVNSTDADTTVSGAQMLALRAAANAGIEVPEAAIKRGVKFYKDCALPGGGFGYVGRDGTSFARTGIGLLVLSLSGEYRAPETKAAADSLMSGAGANGGGYFSYSCYYGSQAMFQAGGKYWQQWNDSMTPLIISTQRDNGSWGDSGDSGGPICGTAMCLLAIEVNYNLLPIYQR
jgi:hypothetical protein